MSILKVGMYASSRIGANQNYLTFSSDNPFSISFTAKHWDGVLEYSPDARNWYTWDASEISSVDNVLYLRGLGNTVITGVNDPAYRMTITSPSNSGVSCTGNIMTLLDHANPDNAAVGIRAFSHLFYGQDKLITSPELPATTLAVNCYRSMLDNCTSLTAAPELPATTLATECYRTMLRGCTSLTAAPELPATTLANGCYRNMLTSTGIAISATRTGSYQTPWRIPSVGTIESEPADWNLNMLGGTSGAFTGGPSINTTYYQAT